MLSHDDIAPMLVEALGADGIKTLQRLALCSKGTWSILVNKLVSPREAFCKVSD
jgi:hypothetical protein